MSQTTIQPFYGKNIARARLELEAAQHEQAQAQAELETIETRLQDSQQRQANITAARMAGTSKEGDAAEFMALGGDIDYLAKMRTEAAQTVARLRGITVSKNELLQRAEFELKHHIETVNHAVLSEKTRQIEALYIQSLRMTVEAGKVIGHHNVRESFTVSETIREVVKFNSLGLGRY